MHSRKPQNWNLPSSGPLAGLGMCSKDRSQMEMGHSNPRSWDLPSIDAVSLKIAKIEFRPPSRDRNIVDMVGMVEAHC